MLISNYISVADFGSNYADGRELAGGIDIILLKQDALTRKSDNIFCDQDLMCCSVFIKNIL